jgi:alpha-L-arabinofuranosidase
LNTIITSRCLLADPEMKIANVDSTSTTLLFTLPYNAVSSTGTATVLTGSETASNTLSDPDAAVPVASTIDTGPTFTYNSTARSFNVLIVDVY